MKNFGSGWPAEIKPRFVPTQVDIFHTDIISASPVAVIFILNSPL